MDVPKCIQKKKKKVITILLALAMMLSLVACGSGNNGNNGGNGGNNGGNSDNGGSGGDSGSFDGVIKVAVAGPMTGDNAEYGIGFSNAAKLMAEQWNADGGVTVGDKTYEVEIVDYDDKSESDEATTIAYNIVSDPDIYGVIGHFASGICMVAAPIYQEAHYVNISPTSSHADYSSIGDYIFRNNTVINVETMTGAEIAINDLGGTKIGVLSIDTEWGQSAGNAMEENIATLGAEMVLRQEVPETAVDSLRHRDRQLPGCRRRRHHDRRYVRHRRSLHRGSAEQRLHCSRCGLLQRLHRSAP